jgi:putative ABC transport system permease protein
MSVLRAWALRFGELFHKEQRDHDLDAEIESHLQLQIEENMRAGMTPDEARRDARLKFGAIESVKEKYREQRGIPWLETFLQDIRFGLRMLRKNPGFTATAILTLALGIGANTAIFTLAYATLLAPLPYPQANQLVNVWSKVQGHRNRVSVGDFVDWKRQSSVFQDVNAWSEGDFNIATQDRPEDIIGLHATRGYYTMLGNPLLLGRDFLPEEGEPGKEYVVILSYRLWRHLGGNPSIVGHPMKINGEAYTVVGVMAPGTADRWEWELIVPLVFKPEQIRNHDARYWLVTGRLKPGVTIAEAQAEMNSMAANEAQNFPKSNQGVDALVQSFKKDLLPNDRQLTLWLLLGAVGFLLLIACLNVANLLLAKGVARQREVAIRSALGAKSATIFAQFLTESLVLAGLGGMAGIVIGYALLQELIAAIPPGSLPAEADPHLNIPVLLTLLGAMAVVGLLFGSAPAWYASRLHPEEALKQGGRSGSGLGQHRLRRILVMAEFAIALPLLTGAGLAIHSFWNLAHIDLGIQTDHILGFYLVPVQMPKGSAQINSYYRRILASIAAVPGVSSACAMTYLPLDHLHAEMPFTIAGRPDYTNPSLRPNADFETVTPDYFRTFGIRIVKGRAFTDADDASSLRVAMVNETFANTFLKGIDPLRQRVVMMKEISAPNGPTAEWQIVGVFHTVKSRGSREDTPEIDAPFWQMAFPLSGMGVRTAEDPAAMVKSIAAAVSAVDSQAALALTRSMEQVRDEGLANERFTAILFASFAGVGLLLAAVGIYGVTAFSVAQRSHEIALRMALGSTRNQTIALVMKEGLLLACIGLALGLLGTYFVGRAMQNTLFGVGAIDFPTLDAVSFMLLLAALLACYMPARRVTRVDPMVALRYE